MKKLLFLISLASVACAGPAKTVSAKKPLSFYMDAGIGISRTPFGNTRAWLINIGAPFFVSTRGAIDVSLGIAFRKKKAPATYNGDPVTDFHLSPQLTIPRVLYKFFLRPKPTTFFIAAGLGAYWQHYRVTTERGNVSFSRNQPIRLQPGQGVYLPDGSLWGDRHTHAFQPTPLRSTSRASLSHASIVITPEIQVGFQFGSNTKKAPKGIVTLAASSEQIYFTAGIGF
jgi:hypothetical protein